MNTIKIDKLEISNNGPLVFIAGPCAMESREHSLSMAHSLKKISTELDIGLVFKSSFDKANRTSIKSKRGVGLDESLDIFAAIKEETNLPILTDVHEPAQCDVIKDYVDILQIPAFLARQTDLVLAAAKTQKPVNIKKSQFMSPWDIKYSVEKILSQSNSNIFLSERGYSFGYNNLVVDFRSVEIMKKLGFPIIFDATHSVQLPGGGETSGGQKEFIESLSTAAVSIGVSGIFAEVHDNPSEAISDGDNQLNLDEFHSLAKKLIKFDKLSKNYKN
ncbi:MAG: 3-deoxy-8-phosphooctulonate synthase [Rhodobiaceae bacterium]|nr:3-deoxy-8-phosphooctulonate synthase [Rhodobiaceae bacterium]